MPEISRFFGIVIKRFYSDHAPPHFHAEDAEHEALVTIETLEVLRGELPRRACPGPGVGRCPPRRTANGLEPRQVWPDARTDRAARIGSATCL
jgi:hypothetical protein